MDTTILGRQGEDAAAAFLQDHGCEILARNFRTPRGEIDIIAREGQSVIFVEVKTRRTERFGRPAAAVGYRKQQKSSSLHAGFCGRGILRGASVVLMSWKSMLQVRTGASAICRGLSRHDVYWCEPLNG